MTGPAGVPDLRARVGQIVAALIAGMRPDLA